MGRKFDNGKSSLSELIVFTDLDGTLLDHNTYEWTEALPALSLCKKLKIPIILVSSKTRAEMEIFHVELALSAPFISENGGGIFFPHKGEESPFPGAVLDGGLWKFSLGLSYLFLIKELGNIRKELGLDIRGFSDMKTEEISSLTGLDMEASKKSALREFDEPFVIDSKPFDKEALFNAASARGLNITEGGRFFHLQGRNDKALAMKKIIDWYRQRGRQPYSMALGDSPNDFSMLECADFPILVRSEKRYEDIKSKIPGIFITSKPGPAGWNEAVLGILKKMKGADGNVWKLPKRA